MNHKKEKPIILVITHPESDYGASMLFEALSLQDEFDVIEYPFKPTYHGYGHRYVRHWLPGSPIGETGRHAWQTPIAANALLYEGTQYGEYLLGHWQGTLELPLFDDVVERSITTLLDCGRVAYIVMESRRRCVVEFMSRNADAIGRSGARLIQYCSEDYTEILPFNEGPRALSLYLKREYPRIFGDGKTEQWLNGKKTMVAAFPFCATRGMMEMADNALDPKLRTNTERDIDAALLCGNTFPIRNEVGNALNEMAKNEGLKTALFVSGDAPQDYENHRLYDGLLPWNEYFYTHANSKCGIAPRGWGQDTVRRWEIALVTTLCAQRLDIMIPNDYTHGVNCLEWNNAGECCAKVRQLIQLPESARNEITNACIQHTREFHSTTARAKRLFSLLADV